jgi:hypothetical protein
LINNLNWAIFCNIEMGKAFPPQADQPWLTKMNKATGFLKEEGMGVFSHQSGECSYGIWKSPQRCRNSFSQSSPISEVFSMNKSRSI